MQPGRKHVPAEEAQGGGGRRAAADALEARIARGAQCTSGGIAEAAGLFGLCFWLQLGLQNLYVACVYQDHLVRDSTVITGAFMVGIVLTSLACTFASRCVDPRPLKRACVGMLPMLLVLLLVNGMLAQGYRLALTVVLAFALGVFTALLMVLWAFALRPVESKRSLLRLFVANLAAIALMFGLFAWFGEVVWFDFARPWHVVALMTVTALAGCAACLLCPVVPDEGPSSPGRLFSRDAFPTWTNFALGQGRIYAGLFVLSFCTTLHWEINAMRNGKALVISWEWVGHQVQATGMAFCYIVLAAAVLALGVALLRFAGERIHARTLTTVLFYAIGCAYSVPGLLGFAAVSSAGITIVGMSLFCVCSVVLLCRQRGLYEFPLATVASLYVLVLSLGLCLGLVVSWAIAPAVNANDVFCVALTALSLFFVMVAPSFLFKASTPSMIPVADAEQDALAASCRRLSLEFHLSPRESEVMELAARGYSAPVIAGSLLISENTVKVHMRHIYEKLGLHSKQELIKRVRGA